MQLNICFPLIPKCLNQNENHYVVRKTVLDVEFPLIESQLAGIDDKLKEAETSLNWSGDVLEYINEVYKMVQDLEQRVQKAKDNVIQMNSIMDVWAQTPIFDRKTDMKVL